MSKITRSGRYGHELFDCRPAIGGLNGGEAGVFQGKSDDLPNMGIVISDKNLSRFAHHS